MQPVKPRNSLRGCVLAPLSTSVSRVPRMFVHFSGRFPTPKWGQFMWTERILKNSMLRQLRAYLVVYLVDEVVGTTRKNGTISSLGGAMELGSTMELGAMELGKSSHLRKAGAGAPLPTGGDQGQHGEFDQLEAAVQHDQRGGFFRFVQRQNQNALQHKVQKRDDRVAVQRDRVGA